MTHSAFAKTMLHSFFTLVFLSCMQACVEMDITESENVERAAAAELSFEWLIVSDGSLVSCVDVGASMVEVVVSSEPEFRKSVSCFGGFSVLSFPTTGSTLVEVSLVAPDGKRIVTAEMGKVTLTPGTTTALGAVEFSF